MLDFLESTSKLKIRIRARYWTPKPSAAVSQLRLKYRLREPDKPFANIAQ